jgi:hypothetical protein
MMEDELTKLLDSFEWIIKDDLRKLDYRIRKIYTQARASGAGQYRIEKYIPKRLQQMFNEVKEEGQ